MQSLTAGATQAQTWLIGDFALPVFVVILALAALASAVSKRMEPFLITLVVGGLVFAAPQIALTMQTWLS